MEPGICLTKYFNKPKYRANPFEILKLDEKLLNICSFEQLLREQKYVIVAPFKLKLENELPLKEYLNVNVHNDISREAFNPMKCTFVEHVGQMKKLLVHWILYKKVIGNLPKASIEDHVYANNQIIVGELIRYSPYSGDCILLKKTGETIHTAWVSISVGGGGDNKVGSVLCTSHGVYEFKRTQIKYQINDQYLRDTMKQKTPAAEVVAAEAAAVAAAVADGKLAEDTFLFEKRITQTMKNKGKKILQIKNIDKVKKNQETKKQAKTTKKSTEMTSLRVESQRADKLLCSGEIILKNLKLKRVDTAADGNCLFHALAVMTDVNANDIRVGALTKLRIFSKKSESIGTIGTIGDIYFSVPGNVTVNNEGVRKVNNFEEYYSRMRENRTYADEFMIFAASEYLKKNIKVVVSNGFVQEYKTGDYDTLTVYNIHMLHFEATTPLEAAKSGASGASGAAKSGAATTRVKRKRSPGRSPSRSPSSPLIPNKNFEKEQNEFFEDQRNIIGLQLINPKTEQQEQKLKKLKRQFNEKYPTPIKFRKEQRRLSEEHSRQVDNLRKKQDIEKNKLTIKHKKERTYLTVGQMRMGQASYMNKERILQEYEGEEKEFLRRYMEGLPYAQNKNFERRQKMETKMMNERHDDEYAALINEQGTELLIFLKQKQRAKQRAKSTVARKLDMGSAGGKPGGKTNYIKLRF